MSIKIAKATPFEGKPIIMMPSIYGASTKKGVMYKIPVLGKRPLQIEVEGLPEGLTFNGSVITGAVDCDTEKEIKVIAKNELGTDEKTVLLQILPDNLLRTPLMGFTTWNAYDSEVTQEKVVYAASLIKEKGISEYGYNYINLDSGWQKEYGGEFDAVMPNDKFPSMSEMCDKLHAMGFKCGIYSTPMLTAWGCPAEFESVPGCTVGEPDILNTSQNGGIGLIHKERNNVLQWEKWGFDYLKYDWSPCDPPTADLMKKELLKSKRDFAFCVTVAANLSYGNYWSKNCNSWRANADSHDFWSNILDRIATVDDWKPYSHSGHFYDMDMLEIGEMYKNFTEGGLPAPEALFSYTLRAFFMSPIQLSSKLDELTEFEFDMICNEEMIKINQDRLCEYPELVVNEEGIKAYKRNLENGDIALAFFNLSDEKKTQSYDFEEPASVYDVWAKEALCKSKSVSFEVEPHCVRVFRISK